MDFSIPETHKEMQALCLDILNDHCNPERLKKLESDGAYFDKELWGKLVETGITSASLPESLGGIGLDYAACSMVSEALGQTVVSVPYIPCIISTCLPLLTCTENKFVNDTIAQVVSGDSILTTAFIEPGNEDALDPDTSASQSSDSWTLNGIKHCVPYAADASKVLVSAIAGQELWAGLVDINQDGVELVQQQTTSNEPQYQISFKEASATCLAQGEDALALFEQSIAMTTVAYCSMACGMAEKMTKITCEYTTERKQFDQALATFQAVSHKLANSYIDTECLKIITLKASSDVNNGDYGHESIGMAKVWCGDVMHRISQASQHLHGGTGIDRDYHLFRYCLWAKQLELSLGSSKSHLANIADKLADHYIADTI